MLTQPIRSIKVSTTIRRPIERQIPKFWHKCGIQVLINQSTPECDAWVVYQGLRRPEETVVPPERLYFFCYEPPGLHDYDPDFLAQFARVITSHRSIRHPGAIFHHQAQPWEAGIERHASENTYVGSKTNLFYEDFAGMAVPQKSRRLSAICSRKVMVPGHQARIGFVENVRSIVGYDFDLFGYGFRPVIDKWQALLPYSYHLVLENSCVPDYWTEKLADAYLGWCLPLVWGCPNLGDYFPAESFVSLNPNDPAVSLELLQETIRQPPTERRFAAVTEARRLVLEKYNLFSEIRRLIELTPASSPQKVRLQDERLYLPGGWCRPAIRMLSDWRRLKA